MELIVQHALTHCNWLLKIVDDQMSLAVLPKHVYPIAKFPCDTVYGCLNLLGGERGKITPEVRRSIAGLHGEDHDIWSKIVQSACRIKDLLRVCVELGEPNRQVNSCAESGGTQQGNHRFDRK